MMAVDSGRLSTIQSSKLLALGRYNVLETADEPGVKNGLSEAVSPVDILESRQADIR